MHLRLSIAQVNGKGVLTLFLKTQHLFLLDPKLLICQDSSDEDTAYAESINDNLNQQIIPTLLNLINERPDHTP